MNKEAYRKKILQTRKDLSAAFLTENSRGILSRLTETKAYKNAAAVYTYIGCRGEVLTEELLARCREDGKKTAVPCIEGDEMVFRYVSDETEWKRGALGIPEPVAAERASDEAPLFVVPGLVFTKQGERIGHGGGYYDRYMKTSDGVKCGIAFSFQIEDEIPVDAHDVPVDMVITEKEVHTRCVR